MRKTFHAFQNKRFADNDEAWTTFGGNSTRNRPLSEALSVQLFEDGPTWRVKLPPLNVNGETKDPDRLRPTRRAAFHPVIAQQQVLLADHRSVVSYHLKTGKELFRFDLKSAGLKDPGPGIDAKVLLPRFTLSVDDERAYVRLGGVGIGPTSEDVSYLVCLDLTHPEQKKPRLLWHIKASTEDKAHTFFEGSPLVHEGRVYVAQSKLVERRVATSIVCFDTQRRQRWTRAVCDGARSSRGRHMGRAIGSTC